MSDELKGVYSPHTRQEDKERREALRDMFAAHALQMAAVMLASRADVPTGSLVAPTIAEVAYNLADAMLAERAK